MIIFYIFAFLLILAGFIIWYFDREVNLNEFLIGGGAALLLAIIFNIIAWVNIHGKTSDIQTFSGRVTSVEYHPKWVEQWEQMHTETYACGTDSKGNTTYCTRIYFTTEYDTHRKHWEALRDFGSFNDSIDIDENLYLEIKSLLGGIVQDGGKQPYHHGGNRYSGDNRIYATPNVTGYIYPATINKNWENKVKAAPNLFQFSKVPTNILNKLEDWPENPNWNKSDRLLGRSRVLIDNLKFDQLNSRLNPYKKVNIILIGLENIEYAKYYQSKFINGKRNDLVICFENGAKDKPATKSFVFSWCENDLVKQNLQTIFLTHPINDDILPLIEKEVAARYQIKDFKKFDYITIRPNNWVYIVYFSLTILIQIGIYIYFHYNWMNKDNV